MGVLLKRNNWGESVCMAIAHLFSFSRTDAQDLGVVVVQNNRRHACKHLLEVLLQFGDILTVAIADKVEPAYMYMGKIKQNHNNSLHGFIQDILLGRELFTYICFTIITPGLYMLNVPKSLKSKIK